MLLVSNCCVKCFVVTRVNCWKVTMCPVICVLNNQLLEWQGQFTEIMKDSWLLTTDPTQVCYLSACFHCMRVWGLV